MTPRGMLDPWARENSKWKKRLFSAFAESAHIKNAACIRATAELEAEHVRAMGLRAPIAIVPNAIPIPDLQDKPESPRRRALFLSRIHPKKGIEFLLRAWRALQADYSEWELVIAGIDERGHEAEMKKLAESLGVSRVSFSGPAFGAAKEALYRSSDLFVLPTHAENFGLVIAEALAQEVPVITTTNAPWSGLNKRQCGWWIQLDRAALENTLRQAMRTPPAELSKMGARGRSWMIEEFGIENVAAALRDLYLWIAGRAPRPETVYD